MTYALLKRYHKIGGNSKLVQITIQEKVAYHYSNWKICFFEIGDMEN